eukprot:14939320-Heterocapsa_arctica.AAC.1
MWERRERQRRELCELFAEMRKRHEFLLTDQDKTAIVSEMHRLRMRVVELEEQVRFANHELTRVRKTAVDLELE